MTAAGVADGQRWLSVRLPAELVDRLDVECEIATIGRNLLVRRAVEHYLDALVRRGTR